MSLLLFTALIWVCSLGAGLLGSLTGLGGGMVIVPLLLLVFKVDIHYAAGASLISVIATSSGAAAAYRSEERRVGKECRSRWVRYRSKNNVRWLDSVLYVVGI